MEQNPFWNEDQAETLIGKVILAGITYVENTGERHEQCFGEVQKVDSAYGICLRLSGTRDGETYWLPPDLRAIQPANPGSYRLKSTGEFVEDPDFTATWTVHPKQP